MDKKIIVGIIIIITLLIVVGYLSIKLKHSDDNIDDLKSKFKNVWWIITNQAQQTKPSDVQITKEQANCLIDSMISKYGISDTIASICFPSTVLSSIKSGTVPLQETMDYLNNSNINNLGPGCDGGKKCNVPSKYFNQITENGSPITVCNY